MQRCPAPCDGTVPITVYLAQINRATELLTDPTAWRNRIQSEMKHAAADQQYEAAGAAKALLDRTKPLFHHEARLLSPILNHNHLILQQGSRANTIRIYHTTPNSLRCLGQLHTKHTEHALAAIHTAIESPTDSHDDSPQTPNTTNATNASQLNLAARHILNTDPKNHRHGTHIPLTQLNEQSLHAAIQRITPKRKPAN